MHGINFLDASISSDSLLVGDYNFLLVFLSVVVACLAAYAALGFAERIHTAAVRTERIVWLFAGAIILGLGIWSMHFIGMLAYRLPVQTTYDAKLTLLSLLPAIFSSFVVLLVSSQHDVRKRTIALGAIWMGGGIGAMHYSGMAAMQLPAEMFYDPVLFAISIVVATTLAGASLYMNRLAELSDRQNHSQAVLRASLFMGIAISGMHYTGMSAANFLPTEIPTAPNLAIDSVLLSALVVLVTILILGIAIVTALVDKRLRDADYYRRLSDTRYRSLYESMRDSAILFNVERIIDCNTTTLEMFGYSSKAEFLNTTASMLSPPAQPCGSESTQMLFNHLFRARSEGGQVIPWIHRRKDGSEFPAEIALNSVEIQGEMLYQAIIRDDTRRHRAEEELRESDQLKSSILESALDSVLTLNHEGRIIDCNSMVEHTFGYKQADIEGLLFSEKIISREFREERVEELNRYLTTGESTALSKRIEVTAKRSDGSKFPVELAIVPIQKTGSPMFTAYLRDITEAVRDREDLQTAKEDALRSARQAEEANQAKSIFLANMSHEIRTPMNAILGFTEILSGHISDPQHKDYLKSIQTSAKVFLGLINDILDLSKVEAGGMEINTKPVDIYALGNDIRAIFEQQVKKKGLDFSVEISSRIPRMLLLDEQHMRQIMVNLIGNAIKFTDEGSVRLNVEESIDTRTDKTLGLVMTVADTGVGIAEDQIDAVFGIFAQQKGQSINKYGGTGLGLSISKRLVELMGGEITVHSEVDAGSIFRVVIEGIEIADNTVSAMEQIEDFDASEVVFEPATILIADVISDDRKLVNAYLEGNSFTILEADNGESAMEMVEREKPDLVLMDIKMPSFDGFKALQSMKADATLKDIPVVVITAPTMQETESKVRELCDGYLRKPISKQQLFAAISAILPYESLIENESLPADVHSSTDFSSKQKPHHENTIARFPILLDLLERELDTAWPELHKSGNINRLEVFASKIGTLGDEYQYDPIADWANRLKDNTSLFQVDLLPKTMSELPDLVEELRKLTSSELHAESA